MTSGKTAAERAYNQNVSINFASAADYNILNEYISYLSFMHRCIRVTCIGTSVMGRRINAVTLGEDLHNSGVIYVGGLSGCDMITPLLLRFISDYAGYLEARKRMYSVNMSYLYKNRIIHIVPMLNPDGYSIRKYGVEGTPGADRLIKQNGGDDFGKWRFNARGVDLERNFIRGADSGDDLYSGVAAQSEPETSALCSYIRMSEKGVMGDMTLALTLNAADSELRYTSGNVIPERAKTVARLISRMTGCRLNRERSERAGFTDWFIREHGRAGIDCGCLDESMTADMSDESVADPEDYIRAYAAYREALFSSPLLI